MISKQKVTELALEKIKELDYFLVDVKISATNEITVLFDKNDGVVIDDCLKVSRHIESNLDRDIENYQLTVCSPGIDKKFLVREQFIKNIGSDIKIKTLNGQCYEGVLVSYDDVLILEVKTKQKKKKELLIEKIEIPLDSIKETKLILKFK